MYKVHAEKGSTEINLPCHSVKATTVDIENIHKVIELKEDVAVAAHTEELLRNHGWENVYTFFVDTAA